MRTPPPLPPRSAPGCLAPRSRSFGCDCSSRVRAAPTLLREAGGPHETDTWISLATISGQFRFPSVVGSRRRSYSQAEARDWRLAALLERTEMKATHEPGF